MRFFIPAAQVVRAAKELEECEMDGYVFESDPFEPVKARTECLGCREGAPCIGGADCLSNPQASSNPKVYQRTPGGGKIRVAAVVCTQCGHENEMKDMEFEPG